MHITRGRPPVITTYFLNGQALEVTDSHPYLGVLLSHLTCVLINIVTMM